MPNLAVSETVAAPPERVFAAATDFPNCADYIEGIQRVEMLTDGPVGKGTRFRETRKLFGKEATEEMEIVEYDPPRSYVLGAESHGSRYRTELRFEPEGEGTKVTMDFQATPLSGFAKVMTVLAKPMMKSMAKMCAKDLKDIKQHVEGGS